MGKPVNVVRVTISVPRYLKELMDFYGDDANWSAIASAAFKRHIESIPEEKLKKEIEDLQAKAGTILSI